ncbi:hypothetical protein Daus18300_001431 [Diaporthe australafricana]|uniref:Uncharacterized protein n=1 Tax=Diaporthe australafricana TaxID=127596 RepID=A0ABR3XVN2_9PEZI
MFIFKALVLAVSTTSLVTASVLGSSHTWSRRSEGTVAGAEDGVSYHFNSTGTSDTCVGLSVADLESSLVQFDTLFPPQYNAGPYYEGQTTWGVGALYLDTASGVKAFYISYSSVTPNTTATWVDAGADIFNVWVAVREDIAEQWAEGLTFQWAWYSIDKTVDGVDNHAGEFAIQVQTPTFVKGCDTSCGGHCNPNICAC